MDEYYWSSICVSKKQNKVAVKHTLPQTVFVLPFDSPPHKIQSQTVDLVKDALPEPLIMAKNKEGVVQSSPLSQFVSHILPNIQIQMGKTIPVTCASFMVWIYHPDKTEIDKAVNVIEHLLVDYIDQLKPVYKQVIVDWVID